MSKKRQLTQKHGLSGAETMLKQMHYLWKEMLLKGVAFVTDNRQVILR